MMLPMVFRSIYWETSCINWLLSQDCILIFSTFAPDSNIVKWALIYWRESKRWSVFCFSVLFINEVAFLRLSFQHYFYNPSSKLVSPFFWGAERGFYTITNFPLFESKKCSSLNRVLNVPLEIKLQGSSWTTVSSHNDHFITQLYSHIDIMGWKQNAFIRFLELFFRSLNSHFMQ
jgi:hypothetical protein